MSELVFLLEEPSAKAMLEGLLPRLLPEGGGISVRYIQFEGKSDLDKNLQKRLSGYLVPDARFVVLRDKDSADCHSIKAELVKKCIAAGRPNALVRIVCHELESWYLADLQAVEQALNIRGLSAKQATAKYRTPDDLANAKQELKKISNRCYQQISGSRLIGPLLDIDNTRSRSFSVFIEGIRKLVQDAGQ
jgi:hypothetical protein